VLRRGDEARMNVPGSAHGNWGWRCLESDLDFGLAEGLRTLTETYGRLGNDKPAHGENPWDYTIPGSSQAIVDSRGLPLTPE
jgi:hypothetical protein